MRIANKTLAALLCLLGLGLFLPLSASAKSPSSSDLRSRAEDMLQRGLSLESQTDPKSALYWYEQSVIAARSSGDQSLLLRCLIALAGAYIAVDRLQEAIALCEEVLATAKRTGDLKLQANAMIQIGNAYYDMDEKEEALSHFRAALPLAREAGDKEGEGSALKDIGITCRGLGRFDEALQSMHGALEIFRELNDDYTVASLLENLGVCYSFLGASTLAMEYFDQALSLARNHGYEPTSLNILTRVGYVYADAGLPDRALSCFEQALEIARRFGIPRREAWVLMSSSLSLFELGRTDDALRASRRSMELYRQIGSQSGVANNLRDIGAMYLATDPAKALSYFEQSLSIFDTPLVWGPHHGMGRAYGRMGDLTRAAEHYRKAIDRIESVRVEITSDQHRVGFLDKHQDAYRELIDVLVQEHERDPRGGFDVQAYDLFERFKARALAEAISARGTQRRVYREPDLEQRQQKVNKRIVSLQRQLIESDLTIDDRARLLSELTEAEQAFDRLTVELKRHDSRYDKRHSTAPPSLGELQSLLIPNAAVVAYLLMTDQILGILVTSTSFHIERLNVRPDMINARVGNYVDLLAKGSGSEWQEISRQIYNDLVAPLRVHLPSEINRMIIVPDSALNYLPFETLIREGAEPHYLLEDFTISYAPSCTVLAELKNREAASAGGNVRIAVFADPAITAAMRGARSTTQPGGLLRSLYEDEGLQISTIPGSIEEARSVIRYGAKGSLMYSGVEASERRIKSEDFSDFGIIHFATHGLVSQRNPARSALVLATGPGDLDDGFLQTREISGLKLHSNLVVLSGCLTARGRILAGDSVEGLAQAFFWSGAQSVIASLWDVNDTRTKELMERFYHHLAAGSSKAGALREAKLDLLRDSTSSAPHHWAAFVLIGEGERSIPITHPNNQRVWVLVIVALVVVAGLIVLTRQKMIRSAQIGKLAKRKSATDIR
jgi:CHAT domain-containing protein/Tfp pilus assembly protein PilF